MTDAINRAAAWGRVGGLTAHAKHGPEVMLAAANAARWAKYERAVDPDGLLPPDERRRRAERLRRADMLRLAARSAEARRKRSAQP